jgi:xanthine dehydrogenase iron-sulfur cluster and FAD-binding subunit A
MLNTNTLPLTIAVQESVGEHLELSRLLAAATVNQEFEKLLINEPQAALQQGYQDETFLLTQEERDLILSIRADSLPELAQILVRTLGEREYIRCHYPAQIDQYLIR